MRCLYLGTASSGGSSLHNPFTVPMSTPRCYWGHTIPIRLYDKIVMCVPPPFICRNSSTHGNPSQHSITARRCLASASLSKIHRRCDSTTSVFKQLTWIITAVAFLPIKSFPNSLSSRREQHAPKKEVFRHLTNKTDHVRSGEFVEPVCFPASG